MKEFFAFLKTRSFFIHLFLAVFSVSIVVFILLKLLDRYTQHGEMVEVPDFKNKSINELNGFIQGKEVRYLIIDSIYSPKEKPGTVIRQDPEAKMLVKRNRIVYLYVTGLMPPQVMMPKLIDRSERQAILMLESYGLKLGKKVLVSGDCNGCVIGQYIHGTDAEPGKLVKKGSVVDLKIGKKEIIGNTIIKKDSIN
jgi:beta-lactam-binding protein with PASTA domain